MISKTKEARFRALLDIVASKASRELGVRVALMPSVEVHTFTYNDSVHIEHLVKWYSARFHNLKIIVYDNQSTDDTVSKAQSLGCTIVDRGGLEAFGIEKFIELKHKCFKNSESEYTLICDIDELLDVSDIDLLKHQPAIVQGIGYQMVGDEGTAYENICRGVRDPVYDKCLLFRRDKVLKINYSPGAHSCNPIFVEGQKIGGNLRRNLYHFRWLSLKFVIERYERNSKRISVADRKQGFAYQYFLSEKELSEEYFLARDNSSFLPIYWGSKVSGGDTRV